MRIAVAQINTSMGALEGNADRISRFLAQAARERADLTVFPELALVGYPPKDLLENQGFVERTERALKALAAKHRRQTFVVGTVAKGGSSGKGRFNSAAVVSEGKIKFVQHKRLLPSYDVFDETRYFDAGDRSRVVRLSGMKVGITICEDIWTESEFLGRKLYVNEPGMDLKRAGAELLINLSASPFHDGKAEVRRKLSRKLVSRIGMPLIYANLVGGNDELLFDGGSFALDAAGRTLARARMFDEDLVTVDFEAKTGEIREWPEEADGIRAHALVMGLRDYVKKCGFSKVVLGLSGGIDSSLVALLAAEALGPDQVIGVSMPSRFTSDESLEDAEKMARRLKIGFHTIPIEPVVRSYESALARVFDGRSRDVTEENIQARIRGNYLMALSNKFGWLVLSTGNKSELAVGYCTQYGDMAGGLAVISDLPKGRVYSVARFLNRKWDAIPERVFTRPPTAELREDQRDEDSLPPYPVLDEVLQLYIEERKSADAIVKAGFERETVDRVIRMVDQNEFKRKQAAPGLRLSAKAFGVGRRMPIARGAA